MLSILLKIIGKILSWLPLWLLYIVADGLGLIMYYVLPSVRERVHCHLQYAELLGDTHMVKHIFQETIKSGLELPHAFFRDTTQLMSLFTQVNGWEYVQEALDKGEGLLFLTPHLGSYDLAGRYLSERLPFPLTAMYKPPKIKALDDFMQAGRVRGKGRTAPASAQGVKQIIRALRQGEATIILPDHVPNPYEGAGVWANFFGKPAYTMTLATKLAQIKGVKTLFFCGERLSQKREFVLHIEPMHGQLTGNKANDARILNENIEYWIRKFPEQYLFAYNRYKHPAGAEYPPEHFLN